MKKRTKIIGSVVSAALFASLGIGSTFALFTDSKSASAHLVSGSLKARLYMTSLVRDELNSDGYIVNDVSVDITKYAGYESGKGVDLSVYTGKVFDTMLLVPTMTGSATFRLYNDGDVAFEYASEIVNKIGYVYDAEQEAFVAAEAEDVALYSQLAITSEDMSGTVKKGGYKDFTISYEFENLDEDGSVNNAAMNQKVAFDISVVCTQVTRSE